MRIYGKSIANGTEAEDLRNKSSSARPKRYKKIVHTCSFTLPNHVVNTGSEMFEQDQQEVAKCLMMLSRDFGNWNGVSSFMESSDNNSVVLETKSSSIDMKTPKMDASNREKSRSGSKDYDYRDFGVASNAGKHDSRKKSKDSSYDPEYKTDSYKKIKLSFSETKKKKKYECLNCKKIFSSYQALGGHRPCHKRTLESRYETGENRLDVDTTYNNNINGGNHRESLGSRKAAAEGSACYLGTKIKAKNAKGHERKGQDSVRNE
ncbi:PREDICTED: zinc finger protein ZAT4-like [Ipomoea nil]|uniref:zinc finger protein ZAT4-like n=1 Tax=Ipomoea nil TaxID=35883 RepID=UPI0009016029|nr:PREDICTED: zinc finger protein ZAT4-like [Ipomoea nil]